MATVKRPSTRPLSTPRRAHSLVGLLSGPCPTDPMERRDWRALRREVLHLADQQFDPRQVLGLSPRRLADWHEARLAWLAEQYRDDARVTVL